MLQPLQQLCCKEQHKHELLVDPKTRTPHGLGVPSWRSRAWTGRRLGCKEVTVTRYPAPGWRGHQPTHPSPCRTWLCRGHILVPHVLGRLPAPPLTLAQPGGQGGTSAGEH